MRRDRLAQSLEIGEHDRALLGSLRRPIDEHYAGALRREMFPAPTSRRQQLAASRTARPCFARAIWLAQIDLVSGALAHLEARRAQHRFDRGMVRCPPVRRIAAELMLDERHL